MTQDILEKLHVNDGLLAPTEAARLRESEPSMPMEELRRRFHEDGYLFLRGLLPREDMLKAREHYFSYMEPTGVLKPGTTPVQGIFDPAKDVSEYPCIGVGRVDMLPPSGCDFKERALDAHGHEWYTRGVCNHPALVDFISRFTGWGPKTLPLVRTLLRNNIPQTPAIGVHYDQIFLRQGEPSNITAWVPMGDIRINGGGLIYLENSHGLGEKFENDFTEKAMASGMTKEEATSAFNQNMLSTGTLTDQTASFGRQYNRRWLVTDYQAGDVVLHTSYTIHSSTVNHDPDNVIRLATDLRFVDSTQKWDKRWDNQFREGDGV